MRLIVIAISFLGGSIAAQQSPLPDAPKPTAPFDLRWAAVEKLHPGEFVEVREGTSGEHTECLLERADDAALACQPESASAPYERVVLPSTAIDRVWVFRTIHESNRKWVYVAAGVGGLIGAGLFSQTGVGGAFLGLGLGASVGASFASMNSRDHIVTRRRLIYARP